jgi:hypothetical protein
MELAAVSCDRSVSALLLSELGHSRVRCRLRPISCYRRQSVRRRRTNRTLSSYLRMTRAMATSAVTVQSQSAHRDWISWQEKARALRISMPSRYRPTDKRATAGDSFSIFARVLHSSYTALDVYDVEFESDKVLRYIHKIKEGRHIYMFPNISPRTIDTRARLRGSMKPDFWNPHTGEISQAECAHEVEAGMDLTAVRVTLAPFKSVFIVGGWQ